MLFKQSNYYNHVLVVCGKINKNVLTKKIVKYNLLPLYSVNGGY